MDLVDLETMGPPRGFERRFGGEAMSGEFWAILGVGVALAGLHWRTLGRIDALNARIDSLADRIGAVEQRLARIEGWIAGRFREDVAAQP